MDYCLNILTGNVDIFYGDRIEEIKPGDRFYHNNYTTRIGATIPDYLLITSFKHIGDGRGYFWINARYENHSVDTIERMFSSDIIRVSNLNPAMEKPEWIFVRKDDKNG